MQKEGQVEGVTGTGVQRRKGGQVGEAEDGISDRDKWEKVKKDRQARQKRQVTKVKGRTGGTRRMKGRWVTAAGGVDRTGETSGKIRLIGPHGCT